jgi:multicomponent Na+:H+ antiporter subunit E
MKPLNTKIRGFTLLSRGFMFAFIWWILSDGAIASWLIGIPAVLLAVAASVALVPPVPVVWSELLRFVSFFVLHSLLGGVDVARRAFHPDMPIDPDLIAYPLRLPQGLPQVIMANIISLLPGTLSATLDQNVLKVHVLDRQTGFLAELEALERHVARMLNLSLNSPLRGE